MAAAAHAPISNAHPRAASTSQSGKHGREAHAAPENATLFEPTRSQLKLAQVIDRGEVIYSIRGLCAAAGVDFSTYYRWRRDPGFLRWFGGLVIDHIMASGPVLLLQGTTAALDGDQKAWKTMFSFIFSTRGLPALDAFMARVEANCRAAEAAAPMEAEAAARSCRKLMFDHDDLLTDTQSSTQAPSQNALPHKVRDIRSRGTAPATGHATTGQCSAATGEPLIPNEPAPRLSGPELPAAPLAGNPAQLLAGYNRTIKKFGPPSRGWYKVPSPADVATAELERHATAKAS